MSALEFLEDQKIVVNHALKKSVDDEDVFFDEGFHEFPLPHYVTRVDGVLWIYIKAEFEYGPDASYWIPPSTCNVWMTPRFTVDAWRLPAPDASEWHPRFAEWEKLQAERKWLLELGAVLPPFRKTL